MENGFHESKQKRNKIQRNNNNNNNYEISAENPMNLQKRSRNKPRRNRQFGKWNAGILTVLLFFGDGRNPLFSSFFWIAALRTPHTQKAIHTQFVFFFSVFFSFKKCEMFLLKVVSFAYCLGTTTLLKMILKKQISNICQNCNKLLQISRLSGHLVKLD